MGCHRIHQSSSLYRLSLKELWALIFWMLSLWVILIVVSFCCNYGSLRQDVCRIACVTCFCRSLAGRSCDRKSRHGALCLHCIGVSILIAPKSMCPKPNVNVSAKHSSAKAKQGFFLLGCLLLRTESIDRFSDWNAHTHTLQVTHRRLTRSSYWKPHGSDEQAREAWLISLVQNICS